MDIMYIDSIPILHIVDESTRFSAARFLPNVSTRAICETFISCWAPIYTGLPNRILFDQGSNLCKSESFVSLAGRENVEVQGTVIKAHSSLGIGERYHEPVRTTFCKMVLVYPDVDKTLPLQMAIKAMNDTLGP